MKKFIPVCVLALFVASCTNRKEDTDILCQYKGWVVVDKDITNEFELVLQKDCDIHTIEVYPHQYFKYEKNDTIGRQIQMEKLESDIENLEKRLKQTYE